MQLSILDLWKEQASSGKSEAGELKYFIFCFMSNKPCFLSPGLLCFEAKGVFVSSPGEDAPWSTVIKTSGECSGGIAAAGLCPVYREAVMVVACIWCFIKAERRKTLSLGGKQGEQVTNRVKEGRKCTTHYTTGRCMLSSEVRPHRGRQDTGPPRMTVGKGRTVTVKEEQWQPCR